jgi:hypothetical protein
MSLTADASIPGSPAVFDAEAPRNLFSKTFGGRALFSFRRIKLHTGDSAHFEPRFLHDSEKARIISVGSNRASP